VELITPQAAIHPDADALQRTSAIPFFYEVSGPMEALLQPSFLDKYVRLPVASGSASGSAGVPPQLVAVAARAPVDQGNSLAWLPDGKIAYNTRCLHVRTTSSAKIG